MNKILDLNKSLNFSYNVRKKILDMSFNAGSASVAPKPRMKAKPITIDKPVTRLNIGELSLTGISMKAAGKTPPVCEPIAPRPYVRPILKMHIPRIDKVNP